MKLIIFLLVFPFILSAENKGAEYTPYVYKATVKEVYDGDTITIDIDLGFNIVLKDQKIRLLGVNTTELRGEEKEEGLKVRDAVRKLILNKEIIIKTERDKKGRYGRWLAVIYIGELNLNQMLIDKGYKYK